MSQFRTQMAECSHRSACWPIEIRNRDSRRRSRFEHPDLPQSARDRSQLPPEDGRRIAVHFSEEPTDIPRRFDPLVEMESKVAIPPVQGPLLPSFREVKPGDWEPSPFRTDVRSPRRVALKDCEMAIGCIALDPELVCQVIRDSVPTPLLDASDIATRKPRTVWHGHEHAVDAHGCHQLRAHMPRSPRALQTEDAGLCIAVVVQLGDGR